MTELYGPKITIITACYNSEKTIEQTIQSVLNQTYDNIEYIVIDGASTDGTMEIVEKYRDRIDIIVSEEDDGVYDAFNKGIKVATGDFINFMNADDYFSTSEIIEEIACHIEEHKGVLMIHGNVRAFDERTGHWHFRGGQLILDDFEKGKMCPHQSVFTHKKLFEEFKGFDLKYKILADVDFTIKCFKNYEEKIIYIPIEIACFRLGGLSNALRHEKNMHTENAIIHFNQFGSIPDYSSKIIDDYETYHTNQNYRLWLERSLLNEKYTNGKINSLKGQRIAVFGTKKNATYLYHDLKKSGIDIKFFLDNDERMQNQQLHKKPIISLEEINNKEISTIIISIERYNTAEIIKQQLQQKFQDIDISTWYELV